MRKVRSSKRLYSINSKMLAAVSTNLLYQISPNSDNKYGKNLCKLIYAPKYKERLSLHRFAGNTYREFYVNPTYGLVGHRRTFVQQAHYLLTYLLTPCSRCVLEKLTASQLVKKFTAFYGTRRFFAAFEETATCPSPEPDQSSPCPHPTSWISILILSFRLSPSLSSGLFRSDFPTKTLYGPIFSPYVLYESALTNIKIQKKTINMSAVLYVCETLFLTLRGEQKIRCLRMGCRGRS